MADLVPTRKIGTAGTVGALSIVLVWLLGRLHVDMPVEVATAVGVLLATGAGYLTPQKPS